MPFFHDLILSADAKIIQIKKQVILTATNENSSTHFFANFKSYINLSFKFSVNVQQKNYSKINFAKIYSV